jgi:ketosteroid isomerase-like protein
MARAIANATAAFATALNLGDAAGAAALYLEDARLLAPTTELVAGRSEIEAYWRTGIGLGLSRVELKTRELRFVSSAAFEIGRYSISLDENRRKPVVDLGHYFALHVQAADGTWSRSVDVFNADGAGSAVSIRKEEPC